MPSMNSLSAIPAYNPDATQYVDHSQQTQDLQDNFFMMLTAQLQYQDPMKPMENTEFTNQMVGFYNLQQQQASNTLLQRMLDQQQGDGMNQAVSYLGQSLIVEGESLTMSHGAGAAYFETDTPITAQVMVYDENGRLVKNLASQPYDAGMHRLDISDPMLADGNYTFSVRIDSAEEGSEPTLTTYTTGVATGLVRQSDGVRIRVNDLLVSPSQIRQVDRPVTAAAVSSASGGSNSAVPGS